MVLPLKGIRVLDFSIAFMGPLAAAMLGDMGADVVKIERVQGELGRLGLPAGMEDLVEEKVKAAYDSAFWMANNRNKKSLAVDVRQEQGKEIALKLSQQADVVIQSFRPGVMDRLGLGYRAISAINPRVIYCSLSGYGETGPLSHRAGGDMWSQAMTGAVSVGSSPGTAPYQVPVNFVDHGGAIIAAYGVMTALFVRERGGPGQELTVNSIDAAMLLQNTEISAYLLEGKLFHKMGRGSAVGVPPAGPYQARDGDVLTISGQGPQWSAFCRLLGLEHLEKDPRFDSDERRMQHREELYPLLDEAFGRKTRDEWQKLFHQAKMRCDPCLTYAELVMHPQVATNQMVVSVEHPARGTIKMLGLPVKLKKTPGEPQRPPPLLGQHSEEILLGLGYTAEDIAGFVAEGIVKTAGPSHKERTT